MATLYFIGNKYVNRKLKKGVVIPCHEYLSKMGFKTGAGKT
jgi:hypothetical protein